MISLPPIDLNSASKLATLRRLDRSTHWESLRNERQCRRCGEVITGRDIEIVGGTREYGPLRMQCPTPNCPGTAADMVLTKPATFGGTPGFAQVGSASPAAAANRARRQHKAASRFLRVLGLGGWARAH